MCRHWLMKEKTTENCLKCVIDNEVRKESSKWHFIGNSRDMLQKKWSYIAVHSPSFRLQNEAIKIGLKPNIIKS